MTVPRKRDADATRSRLLAIATSVYSERGFDGARVDDIATRAGVNKRMIYAYFGDKDGLYREVLSTYFSLLTDLSQAGLAASTSPCEQVAVIVRRYFDFLAAHPQLVRLLAWEQLSRDARAEEILLGPAAAGLDALRDVIRRGVATGELRPGLDERKTIASINSLVQGFFQQRPLLEALWDRPLSGPAALDEIFAHLLALVFDGICAGARREPAASTPSVSPSSTVPAPGR